MRSTSTRRRQTPWRRSCTARGPWSSPSPWALQCFESDGFSEEDHGDLARRDPCAADQGDYPSENRPLKPGTSRSTGAEVRTLCPLDPLRRSGRTSWPSATVAISPATRHFGPRTRASPLLPLLLSRMRGLEHRLDLYLLYDVAYMWG